MPAGLDNPPDQTVAVDHRLPLADAAAGAGGDQDCAHERAARIADHPRGNEVQAGLLDEVEQVAVRHVLVPELARRRLPVPEPVVLLAQTDDLATHVGELAHVLDDGGGAGDRPRQHVEHGCRGVGDGEAQPFDVWRAEPAENEKADRRGDKQREREPLDPALDGRGQVPHRAALLSHAPLALLSIMCPRSPIRPRPAGRVRPQWSY